jgi:hypothetical protein
MIEYDTVEDKVDDWIIRICAAVIVGCVLGLILHHWLGII